MPVQTMTSSTKRALVHLKKIRPHDGWAVETQSSTNQVRLLRRNVPLTSHSFWDLHFHSSGNVVGILTKNKPYQAQVLVDPEGIPTGKTAAIIYVTTWKPESSITTTTTTTTTTTSRSRPPPYNPMSSKGAVASRGSRSHGTTRRKTTTTTTTRSTRRTTSARSDTTNNNNNNDSLSEEQNQELMKYAAYAVGAAIILKILLSAMLSLYIILFPIVYLYAVQTSPPEATFEAKKELKRVMRGHHLPEDHPDKPRGWLSETFAKVTASVTTELATGLGYELRMTNVIGACTIAAVNVPSVNRGFLWIGLFGKWRYLYSTELESTETPTAS